MEQKKPITHIGAGLIISAILVLYSVVFYFLDLYTNRPLTWLAYLIPFAGIILFINLYARAYDYRRTFGDLFSYGFKATTIIALVDIAFTLIFHFAFPEFKEKIMAITKEQMANDERLSADSLESSIEMVERYYMIAMIGGTLLWCMITGTLGALVGAGVTKKKKINPLDQLNT
jgi:hypothetical protein